MSAIPGDVDTDSQPPMTVPLRHFVVALAFLLSGGVAGTLDALGALPGRGALAHVHLLLAGWVCVTIMGAMTQFVPVWSGTALHSKRLAVVQLPLVAVGLVGFAAALLAARPRLLPAFGCLMLAGFWTFAYNVARTLAGVRPWDVTERHFALALAFLVAATALGLALALQYAQPVLAGVPVDRVDVRTAHTTLAVFGVVLTTVVGALYQLATMFTQSPLRGVDHHLRRVEEAGYPLGVLALAAGRLLDLAAVARVGGALVAVGLLAASVVLARRLHGKTVAWTPMLRRYAVVAVALAAWSLLALPAWLADPLAPAALFGSPTLVHLLLFGVVAFVVAGTLYHVVPFIVWVHEYSDLLGLRDVPMIDDLYDRRLAAVDLVLLLAGGALLAAADWLARPLLAAGGGALAAAGFAAFAANLLLVVRDHSPHSLVGLLAGSLASRQPPRGDPADADD